MARINPKLNLNKTPQNVEDSSLIFAKNIKLNKDLSISADTSIDSIEHWEGENNSYPNVVGKIVGVNTKVYFFTDENNGTIYEYDELTDTTKKVKCGWTYHNGKITGCVTVNNTGEEILTIAESYGTEDVPIKHINLSQCDEIDEESIYTQHPNIPITNLNLSGYYTCQIPNGVYQFFIRYKIRDEFYTNWFPASKELFAGNRNSINTVQGKLNYTDLTRDADESFILNVEHLYDEYLQYYQKYQIGFIVNNDNGSFARSWKEFDISNSVVYFDYIQTDIKEINIDDLLRVNYEIFNVKNVINYKNKLYIANYKESDFNINDETIGAEKIQIVDGRYKPDTEGIVTLLKDQILIKENNTDNYYKYIGTKDNSRLIKNIVYFNTQYCNSNYEEVTFSSTQREGNDRRSYSEITETMSVNTLIQKINNKEITLNKTLFLGAYIANNNNQQTEYYDLKEQYGTIINNRIEEEHYYNAIDNFIPDGLSKILFINNIKESVLGLNESDNKFLFKTYDSNKTQTNITSDDVYLLFSYTTREVIPSDYTGDVRVIKKYILYKYTSLVRNYLITQSSISTGEYPHKYNTNTLLPFVSYDFYIHYVKQNGVTTNGYFIKSITPKGEERVLEHFKGIVYPIFRNILNPLNYSACFISMVKSDTILAECFNYKPESIAGREPAEYIHTVDCLELDTLLYNLNDNITIVSFDNNGELVKITDKAKYYASGDSRDLKAFGSRGYITWTDNQDHSGSKLYVYIENNNSINKNELIKVTPYIKLDSTLEEGVSYDNFLDLNLRGYICQVSKLKDVTYNNKQLFISGSDAFLKTIDGEYSDHIKLDNYEEELLILNSEENIEIKSSFNLNFLNLTEKITPQNRLYKVSGSAEATDTELITTVNSLIASSIYTLAAMYKDYTTKLYSKTDYTKFTQFNNTVRSSNIDVDEVYRNIYKFDAEDYYNVPTNRGIIINMFTIVNKIYVHCEHALFVFTDTNMMKVGENLYTSNNTEVALQQSSPFEIGIQEVLDSAYGYAGIQNKKHSLVTFNSYIFYDKLANTIYAYGGDSQITPISDSIDKLLKWFQPEDILFAADDTNNRFFINLRKVVNDNYENVCLSFNFTAKSFISIHDMDFDESFNSRINTYFSKQIIENDITKTKVFKISKTERDSNTFTTNYNELKQTSALQLYDVDSLGTLTTVANSIDIVCNINYEKTKVLNWINWICQEIINYNSNDGITLAEESVKKYSGHFLRIYSDETYSPLLPLTNDENEPLMSNNVPLSVENGLYNPAIRKYPRYNCGVWSMNNFRDIKNTTKGNKAYSDDKSLLYGKYFVIRFIFKDKNFKFENIKYNMGNYEKN